MAGNVRFTSAARGTQPEECVTGDAALGTLFVFGFSTRLSLSNLLSLPRLFLLWVKRYLYDNGPFTANCPSKDHCVKPW
jgi:hypothetical protein